MAAPTRPPVLTEGAVERPAQQTPPDGRHSTGGLTRAMATLIAALAAAPGVLALCFQLWPVLRPDPRDQLAAELTALTVDRDVALRDFLARSGTAARGVDRISLRGRGYVVYLKVQIRGRKRHDLKLRESVYRVSTGHRVSGSSDVLSSYFKADTPNDQWIQPVFVPIPYVRGEIFVRFELKDGATVLAFADTDAMPGGLSARP